MVKKIKFVINSDGEVQINVEGTQGSECDSFSAPFEAVLGEVKSKTLKDSYYQENETGTSIENNFGA